MTTKSKLIIITGPSGSGKSTLESNLVLGQGFKKLVSFTTRDSRPGEENGKDYWFVTPLQVEKWEGMNNIIEKVNFGGNTYGLLKTELSSVANGEGPDRVVVLEPHGVDIITEVCKKGGIPFRLIILIPPLEEVSHRLVKRYMLEGTTDAENKLIARLPTLIRECVKFYEELGAEITWTMRQTWYHEENVRVVEKSALRGEEEYDKILSWIHSDKP